MYIKISNKIYSFNYYIYRNIIYKYIFIKYKYKNIFSLTTSNIHY